MKKVVKIFSAILSVITLLAIVTLCGCSNNYTDPGKFKKEENGFYYYLVAKNGDTVGDGLCSPPAARAIILGINENASNTDELIIPETLGGYPVSMVGQTFHLTGQESVKYGIDASGYKKVIISHKLSIAGSGLNGFAGELILNDIVHIDTREVRDCSSIQINVEAKLTEIIYIYGEGDAEVKEKALYSLLSNYKVREVKFNAIGGQQKTYKILIQHDKLLSKPEQPMKDGFTFSGWFADENYEVEWNFEENAVKKNMTLYAKWIKN